MSDLRINDVFHTIQGEGLHGGRRALFVRMPYCNLSCSWCDTSFNSYKIWTEEDFKAFATQETNRFAVVTGGEPLMNKQTPKIISILKSLGFYIAVETNGTFPALNDLDWITCSPKEESNYLVHGGLWQYVNEFKYVIDEGFKWDILKRHDLTDGRRYSLSPEFNRFEKSVQEIIEYIKENPQWKINLQTHKWLKIP
jgi:7-carboxy-7-deazaguanine synthase